MSAVIVRVSHAYRNMDMARERISLILELMAMLLSFQMTFSLVTAAVAMGYPGEYFRLGSLIRYYSSQIFKASDGLQFLVVYDNISADAIDVICHQLGLLICLSYAVEASSRSITNLTSSCSCPAGLSMSSAKRKFVIVLPPILTVPSWSSSALAIIFTKKMLKRVGKSRHPWRTPVVVRNHSAMLLSW